MPIRNIFISCMTILLLAGLTACEQPEEELTPPAAYEKSAPRVISTREDSQATPPEVVEESEETADESADDDVEISELAQAEEDGLEETGLEEASADVEEEALQPVALFPSELLDRKSAHICFFSFNSGNEYYQLKRMVTQLNEASNADITVTEYQVLDADPYDSFVNLLTSGKQCDGVVLSGHHTDEFYGERSDGDLEIEDLEELACEPRHAEWFSNIKALWLQGCNTVKAGVTNTDVDEDELITGSPIKHMQRLLDPSDMEESVDDMRDLLYENTNEENLVNDYMRVFSGATVYGWSFKAPGEQAGAQKSIPYHLAQVTRLVENDNKYFVNPLQTRIPPTAAERYSQVLYGVLKRPNRPGQDFPEALSEKTFMQAWRDHGNYRYRYAFDNHDIEAFPALGNSNNEVLKQLKGLTCLMHQLDDDLEDMSMLQVTDYILRDRTLTTYNTYLLWAMLRSLPEGSEDYKTLRQRLVSNDHLVRELRFNTALSGYSQSDADAFLAALGPQTMLAEPKQPEDAEVTEAETDMAESPAPAPVEEPATVATEQPAQETTITKAAFEREPVAETPSQVSAEEAPARQAKPAPWYMNEGMGGAAVSEEEVYEQVYEFEDDSPG